MTQENEKILYVIQEKIERNFEILEYYIIFFIFIFSYVLTIDGLNRFLLNVTAALAIALTIITYRIIPQQQKGRFSYTFREKNLLIIMADILLATLLLSATGGPESPFAMIYFFPIMTIVTFGNQKDIKWLFSYFIFIFVLVNSVFFPMPFSANYASVLVFVSLGILLSGILIKYREFMWVLTDSKRSKGTQKRSKKENY